MKKKMILVFLECVELDLKKWKQFMKLLKSVTRNDRESVFFVNTVYYKEWNPILKLLKVVSCNEQSFLKFKKVF